MPETTTQESKPPGITDVLSLLRHYRQDHARLAGIAPGLEDRIWHFHAAEASSDLARMVEQLLSPGHGTQAGPAATPAATS
jgi:hypothetical protein